MRLPARNAGRCSNETLAARGLLERRLAAPLKTTRSLPIDALRAQRSAYVAPMCISVGVSKFAVNGWSLLCYGPYMQHVEKGASCQVDLLQVELNWNGENASRDHLGLFVILFEVRHQEVFWHITVACCV